MSTQPRRVAITGATGLLGSYIARLLVEDSSYQLQASSQENSSLHLLGDAAHKIDWIVGDLRDLEVQKELLTNVDVVIHAAGLVSYSKKDASLLKEINVEVTNDLVNLMLDTGIEHLLHISSIAAISPATGIQVTTEDQQTFFPTNTTTRYARSKYEAELHVWRGKEEGLSVTILNPSVILGGGVWSRSSLRLFPWVEAGQRYYPTGATGYVDVRDVAAFAKTCLENDLSGKRYILNAENSSYKDFFDEVASQLSVKPPSVPVNEWQAEIAWRVEALKGFVTGKSPLLSKESARRSMHVNSFTNSRSIEAGARYRPLQNTIADVANCYKSSKEKGWGILPF